ncbi:4Fe-4S dicluster domain-containing protein [Desulfovibrio sp. OttesenSCG-928-A18]|nr:4Fe-4S dicluster domain-containing protein [Desulfovibrio sp. OttesenSCG-928-A18]
MSDGKSILVDTSRCTGCRGCQVACKQWNGLAAEQTTQRGTYQNPPDFSHQTYKLVRFAEGKREGSREPYWYFFSDMCRHCVNPPCMVASENNEIVQDEETGAVIYTEATKNIDFEMARGSCPYNVPRQNPETKVVSKCTMCFDRIKSGMKPACVLACPTALDFGEREDILKLAEERVAELKKVYPKAKAIDAEDVRVIFIVTDDPKKYHEFAEA